MKKFLGGLLLVVLVFGMTACGSKKDDDKKADIVGEYKMVEMTAGDESLKAEDLEEYGLVYTLKVNKDKTATLSIGDEDSEKLKYDDKYFFPEDDEDDKVAYTVKGNKLTLSDDDTKMVFEKK